MQPDREWLWLAGLFGIVIGAVGLGLAVAGGPVLDDLVEFHVVDDESITGLEVSVDRLSDDGTRSVQRTRVDGGTDVVVFETTRVGSYAVELTRGEATCSRTVTIRNRDGELEPAVRRPADGGACPVSFSVQ
ncbi:hypothetical protein [Salinigranum salinum]|uniref:hypothetical protein n=1 Tax=Salinigranum salinum TaxID=1364937 RepID=UPI001260B2BF|nr:hypothetical protein [Salinigranum salinum]